MQRTLIYIKVVFRVVSDCFKKILALTKNNTIWWMLALFSLLTYSDAVGRIVIHNVVLLLSFVMLFIINPLRESTVLESFTSYIKKTLEDIMQEIDDG